MTFNTLFACWLSGLFASHKISTNACIHV